MPVVPGSPRRIRLDPSTPSGSFGGVDTAGTDSVLNAAGQIVQTEEKRKLAEQAAAEKKFLEFQAKQKQIGDEVAFQDADLEAAKLQTDLEIKAKEMRGRDAAGAIDYVDKEWNKQSADLLKSAANDEQKLMLSKSLKSRYGVLNRSVQMHMASEFQKHDAEQTENYLEVTRNEAALNYGDPTRVKLAMANQEATIKSYAGRNGWSKEQVQNKIGEARSSTHVEVLSRMLIDGNKKIAQAYEKQFNKEITIDDQAIIAKVRKESEEKDKKKRADALFILQKGYLDGQLSVKNLDYAFRNKLIDFSDYKSLKTMVTSVHDDPVIPLDKKSEKLTEFVNKFTELGGKATQTGKVQDIVTGASKEELIEFRNELAEAAPYLPEEVHKNMLLATQENLNNPVKKGLFMGLIRSLQSMNSQNPLVLSMAAAKALSIFDDGVSLPKAKETVDNIKLETQVQTNPIRSQYAVGDIITNPAGIRAKVVGFEDDGTPKIEVLNEVR